MRDGDVSTPATTKGATTRRRLLEAAQLELMEGNGEIELGAVARRASVSPGAPYRYFESKADLMATLVEDFYDRFEVSVFKPAFAEAGDWRTRELQRTRRFVRFFYGEPIAKIFLSMLSGDSHVMRSQWQRIARAMGAAARNIQRGQEAGEIRKDIDPVLAGASVIGGLLHGVAAGLTSKPKIPEARVADAMCRFLVASLELGPAKVKKRR
jgi:AcrR family transcriptional regulator